MCFSANFIEWSGSTRGALNINFSFMWVGNFYAANQPFETVGDAGVTRLNSGLLTGLGHSHQTTEDGTYYYRVVTANSLGSESAPSVLRMAEADRTLPRVEAVEYESREAVAADGRHGPGRIDVRLRMSEQLRNAPFFSLDVPQGGSIPVRLSQAANDSLDYQGSFDLSDAVPSGLLHARVSAYDPVGNEGTEIVEGKTLRVDTQGPDVQSLSLLPGHPAENFVAEAANAWSRSRRTASRWPATATTPGPAHQQDAAAKPTYYFYNEEGLVGVYDAQGNLEQEYAYDPTAPWMSQPLFTRTQRRDTQAWSVSYFGTSHLGTPKVAFERSGEVTWRAQAQAFGETQITLNTIDNALRFPGQYFDAETGLYQNYFMDYDPQLGRYVQSDPIGLYGGLNIYEYVSANPLEYIDPLGLVQWSGTAFSMGGL